MRTVHVEMGNDNQILNSNIYAAFEGFSKKAYDIKPFNIVANITDKNDIVCGRITAVKQAWRHLGVKLPEQLDYPEVLKPFLKRSIESTTIQDIHSRIWDASYSGEALKYFVKPKLTGKLFTGHVVDSLNTKTLQDSLVDMDTVVWYSEAIEFLSEYRVFVQDNKIVGAKNYYGDFQIMPDWQIVKEAIDTFAPFAPIAYSIDMGVAKNLGTVLVEVNDSYALGNYGLASFKYASMIEARWDEIVGNI